jgi:hypothetical protein
MNRHQNKCKSTNLDITSTYKDNAEGGTRTPTGCPIRPSNVRVYQFHHFGSRNHYYSAIIPYFFSGEATGEADGAGLSEVAGDAAGTAAPAGAGDGAAGLPVGVGWVTDPLSRTTELGPKTPGSENSNASIIKITADTIVAFSSGFCAPRGPNAV